MGLGADVFLDPDDLDKSFATGRNFATKLWNIGRFLLKNVGDESVRPFADVKVTELCRTDAWILERLDLAIRECDRAIGPVRPGAGVWAPDELATGLRLNELAETGRRFVWNELADWYLEASKARLLTPGDDAEVARSVLVHVFDQALRLLHPIVPFVSEALWQRLPGHVDGTFLATSSWPEARTTGLAPSRNGQEFELIKAIVEAMRRVRSEYAIPPGKAIDAFAVTTPPMRQMLGEELSLIARLARTHFTFVDQAPAGAAANVVLAGGTELIVPLAGLIDVEKECARLNAELDALEKQLTALEARLANPGFVDRAPAHIVDAERAKREEWRTRAGLLRARVEGLCGRS